MKFDYEILRNEYMGISGSSLLRVIQNNDMPILDLLTREAIQNSLDAKLDNNASVDVEINISKFDENKLANTIEPFGNKLLEKYKNQKLDTFISFSDTNTTGLIGPKNMSEVINNDYGKFINLIFNIGKAQTMENAGGSWGYGKTVYYRAGIGLVIFYSRIKYDDKYESRMVISLVEDEGNTIIPSYKNENRPKTGIMWFGRKNGELDQLNPITNEDEIKQILEIFQLNVFDGDSTGTKVIIPFIDEKKLLDDTNKDDNILPWNDSVDKYIKVAVQRWYSPRLMNPRFKDNPYLKLKINNKYFNPEEDFLPLFKKIQQLYNVGIGAIKDNNVKIENIKLMSTFVSESKAGKIAYAKVNKDELKMNPPYNEPSPYLQIFNTKYNEKDDGYPIITFCRRPGMLLKYDIEESWSNSIKSNEDNYIIGLFIANSNNIVKVKEDNEGKSFEKYLRECEKADHTDWIDLSNYTIIKRIQNQIKNKINNCYEDIVYEENRSVDTRLSRTLTNRLLPPLGFGKRPSSFNKNEKENTIATTKFLKKSPKSNLDLIDESIIRNGIDKTISKDFEINFNLNDRKIEYEFEIAAEDFNYTGNKWEEDFENNEFPIELIKIELLTYGEGEQIQYYINKKINNYISRYEDDNIILEKRYTEKFKKWIGWNIILKQDSELTKIRGRLCYKYNNRNYKGILSKVKEEINNE
jgi:hypothetical protein